MPFCDIYGQERQIAILQNAIRRRRVPHAYLFYGIPGIGKKTVALALASTLNCREGHADFCGRCPSCRKVIRRTHPDVVIIEPEGLFIKIDRIRDLQNQTQFRPLEGRKKVFVVADADRMNDASANALLKTLEEPSPSNVLILTTSRLHRLPQTIVSRCQKVRFQPLRPETVASFLIDSGETDPVSAQIAAAAAGGSIGKVLEIRTGLLYEFKDEIAEVFSGGLSSLDMIFLAESFGKDRETALQRLDIFREWCRDVLIYRELHDEGGLMHPDMAEATKRCAEQTVGDDILQNINMIRNAQGAIEQNANRQLILESMVFRLNKARQD